MRKRHLTRIGSLICSLGVIALIGCSSAANDTPTPQSDPVNPGAPGGIIKNVSLGGGISGITAPTAVNPIYTGNFTASITTAGLTADVLYPRVYYYLDDAIVGIGWSGPTYSATCVLPPGRPQEFHQFKASFQCYDIDTYTPGIAITELNNVSFNFLRIDT